MHLVTEPAKNIIIYSETLDITTIHLQRDIYQQVLEGAKPVILQASQINGTDTASLQLLISFLLTIKQQKITCQWQGCSPIMSQSIQLLGMQHLCMLPTSFS